MDRTVPASAAGRRRVHSHRTWYGVGAEDFSFIFKQLKRGTLVGQRPRAPAA